MKLKTMSTSMVLAALTAFVFSASVFNPTTALAADERNTSEFNLKNGVGLHGYDPVAIFPEGGGKATAGNPQIRVTYMGVSYYFANTQNRDTFIKNPALYEPTYGGYCAYAMAQGCKVDIDPAIFTIKGDRAHYFVSNRAKRNFDADANRLEAQADLNFEKMMGLNLKLGECLP